MTEDRSARAVLINLDAARRARQAKIVSRSGLLHDLMPAKDAGRVRELAGSISLHEAYDIARSIVDRFSAKGSLLQAFIERRKRETVANNEEFHVVILLSRKTVAAYSTDDLRALMALYEKNPSTYYETYVVPAAEEFLYRFQPQAEEA